MSYTLDIVSAPLPQKDREAWLLIHALRAELYAHSGAPSSEMRELHDRLTARYPCICVNESGPWSDGPLINNFGEKMAILGISYSRVAEVLPFVVETATAMGFTVLDAQADRIHRPSGATSAASSANWWQFWKARGRRTSA